MRSTNKKTEELLFLRLLLIACPYLSERAEAQVVANISQYGCCSYADQEEDQGQDQNDFPTVLACKELGQDDFHKRFFLWIV